MAAARLAGCPAEEADEDGLRRLVGEEAPQEGSSGPPRPVSQALALLSAVLLLAALLLLGPSGGPAAQPAPRPGPLAAGLGRGLVQGLAELGPCEQPAARRCLEYGAPDEDCCSLPGAGSCVEGYTYTEGGVCFADNNAVKSCCRKTSVLEAAHVHIDTCAAPTEGKCREDGREDADCCAMPGQGSCAPGYRYEEGSICFVDLGAVATCCKPEPRRPEAPKPITAALRALPQAPLPSAVLPPEQLEAPPVPPVQRARAAPAASKTPPAAAGSSPPRAAAAPKQSAPKEDAAPAAHAVAVAATSTTPAQPLPCTKTGENCLAAACCADKGTQCYMKNQYFGTCRVACEPGSSDPGDKAKWQCKPVGFRTPDDATSMGSWPGDNCAFTKRCNMPDYYCFQKDDYFAGCAKSCTSNSTDGSAWRCKQLGGYTPRPTLEAAAPGKPTMGTSLYCFTVASGASTRTKDEGGLVDFQKEKGWGPFACDANGEYWVDKTPSGDWGSFNNIAAFSSVWYQVHNDGEFAKHDWVVKVDADTVFFPQRLREHLQKLSLPADAAVYIQNTDFKFGFQGSLEVVSKRALDVYMQRQELCLKHQGHDGGEDAFFQGCMNALGIDHAKDASILKDKYTWSGEWDFKDVTFCNDGWVAAFHPVKDATLWMACHEKSEAAENEAVMIMRLQK